MQKANKEAETLKKNSNICNKANRRVERYFTDIRSLQTLFETEAHDRSSRSMRENTDTVWDCKFYCQHRFANPEILYILSPARCQLALYTLETVFR
ncbi:hypothetical protein T02_14817 [Trichinella nativa]|uniref:Uncharacterized protein n=1 Tax=Trichinella nativa TaxID=6335 RepID=A0A0V1KZ82_9BILA|nr:hypothetical protein T09_13755 [Trichinella sp. T9]KRZ52481.1 hypothetical protein T02_14817 [Trichinella nativa]